MKSNKDIDDLLNHFETVCKIYSNESIGVSLYDKDGFHIISRDNKKTCKTCTLRGSCPKKNLNLFSIENTSPELKEIVARDGVAYFEKHILSNSSDNDNQVFTHVNIKLISIVGNDKKILGYFSINNDTTLYDGNRKRLLDEARDKMANSLSLNNIIAWSFDIGSPVISFLNKGEVSTFQRKDFEANIHPDDLKASLKFIKDMSDGNRRESNHIIRFKHLEGDRYHYHESKSQVIMDSDNKPKTIIGTYRDVTDEYLRQQRIEDTQKVLDTVLSESSIMIWDYELSTKSSRIYNDSIFGHKSQYCQLSHNSLKDVSQEDLEKLTDACQQIAMGKKDRIDLIIHIKSVKGETRIAKCDLTYRKNDINVITHVVGCLIDITAQIEREKEEKEKNVMVDLILKTERSNAWFISLKERIFHVALGENFLGTDGKNIDEVANMMTLKSRNDYYELLEKLKNKEITNSIEVMEFYDLQHNSIIYTKNAFVGIYDENGILSGVVGSQKDITEEEMKNRSLRKYQINSEIVNKVAKIIYWEYDLSGKFLYTRGSMHNEGKPMDLQKFLTYIYPDDHNLVTSCMSAMDNLTEKIEPFEVRCFLPQYDSFRWVKFYISPIKNDGKIVSYTGIRLDTNDERLNRAKLERLNSQINQVMYMSEIMPFVWKLERDEFYFTSYMPTTENENNFSKPGTSYSFKYILSCVHPDDRQAIIEIYKKIISGDNDRGWCKVRYDRKHKFKRTFIVSIVPDDTTKDERAFIGYLQDVTNHELLTKRLIDEKLKAEESERLKSNFLANMSHEIRTPLNAIVGFSGLLADAQTKEEMNEYSNIIEKNSDLLLQLINDIIEISRIDAGRTQREPERFSLNTLFTENYTMQKELIKLPDVELQLDIPEEDVTVNLDRRRITELLNNFMSNAAKYTEKGYIRMGFKMENEDRLRLFVKDTGCGIAQENQQKIFRRFEKLNSFVQGAGLGMSICQHYVRDAGGKIWVESKLGEGSTFFVEMKCR